MGLKSNIAANIREARTAVGHTQESLARALGLDERSVRSWELGETAPSRRNLERLAAELGKDPAWFYAANESVAA